MLAIVLSALLACASLSADPVPVAHAERGEFRVALSVPGELEAVRSENISAPNVKGTLKLIRMAEEGAHVKAGEIVAEFDPTDLEKERESAVSRLEIARTKIAQKRAQLSVQLGASQNEVTRSELDLRRAQMRVTESETVPRVERESAKLDVEEFTLAVARTQSAAESTRLQVEAELELLRLDEREAQSKLDQVEKQLGQLVIAAPSDGLVILTEAWRSGRRGKAMVGDNLWPGNPIMELPDLSQMRVEAWVHEVDAGAVKVGQAVTIVVDAQPERPWIGTIEKVADLAVKRDDESTVKHVKLTIALASTDPALKPGMTVRAEILVDALPEVVSVPREAVFHDAARSFVFRKGLAGWARVDVELGRTNDTRVVIVKGLDAGEEVALVDPASTEAPAAIQPATAAATP